ncbi:MAG: hypothetical protein WBB25_18845 [Sulfitobacter sp.]
MSDTALSEEAMLASLRGLRLPAEAAGGWASDMAVAVGVAALMALVVVGIARLWSVKRGPAQERLADRLDRLAGLPEEQQRVALLHLLKAAAPERFEAVRDALYRPQGAVDLDHLRAEITRYG